MFDMKQIYFIFLILYGLKLVFSQEFGFPVLVHEDKGRQNVNKRIPIYSPTKCSENELLYPGDQIDDWICDCEPSFLFYPKTDKCYGAYRQGPCKLGNFLVLPKNASIPICVTNPCHTDGYIPLRGICYPLGKAGPCPNPHLSYVLAINSTTLQATCQKQSFSLSIRIGMDNLDTSNIPICPKGCKRFQNGNCPKTIIL